MKQTIKLNQIWKQKNHEMRVIIVGRKGGKYRAKVLSDKPGIYKGSHTLASQTLWSKYELQ